MGRIGEALTERSLELPQPFAAPPGVEFKFSLVRVSGSHAYVSGHGPNQLSRAPSIVITEPLKKSPAGEAR